MSYTAKPLRVAQVVGVSLCVLLSACSSNQRHKKEVSGNEDYLKTPPLRALNYPAGMTPPLQNGDFDVPAVTQQGQVGKALDIRPPALARPGSAALSPVQKKAVSDVSSIALNRSAEGDLWPAVLAAVEQQRIPVAARRNESRTLQTSWVRWPQASDGKQYQGRYRIMLETQSQQPILSVQLLALQQDGKPVSDPLLLERYNTLMIQTLAQQLNAPAAATPPAGAANVSP